jgi:hypothetical protein
MSEQEQVRRPAMRKQHTTHSDPPGEMTAKEWCAYLNDHPEEIEPFASEWRIMYEAFSFSEDVKVNLLAKEHEKIAASKKTPEERARLHRQLEAFRKRMEERSQAIIRLTDEGVIPYIVGGAHRASPRKDTRPAPASASQSPAAKRQYEDNDLLTYQQAAEVMQCAAKTIRRWVDAGKLQRRGGKASPRVRHGDLLTMEQPKRPTKGGSFL